MTVADSNYCLNQIHNVIDKFEKNQKENQEEDLESQVSVAAALKETRREIKL